MKNLSTVTEPLDVATKEYVDNAVGSASAPVTSVNGKTGAVTLGKSDVGLGNVPNVTTNDQTPTYTEASTTATLTSGEKLSVAFSKISKAISDLISHIANTTVHITAAERTSWNSKTSNTGTVTKVTAGTGLTGGDITTTGTIAVDTDTIATKTYAASVGPVTSVNSKTGAVTLAKGDVGLSNVDNVKQYSASNPPPYPVTSVNGNTGAVTITAESLGLSAALKFIGVSTTVITDGGTQTPTISGYTGDAKTVGNVVLYGNLEFLWTGTAWEQLGDDRSFVVANNSITAGTATKITYDSKGLVTGGASLGSSDVTTALGYTPYNSTNPSGYTTNKGTVTKVTAGTGLTGGDITDSGTIAVDTTSIATRDYAATVGPVTSVNGSTGAVTVNVPAKQVWYATCSTAAGTAAKVATTDTGDFKLATGATVFVKFAAANTYNGTATLNVDGTGAKNLVRLNSASAVSTVTRYFWQLGDVVACTYDGTQYVMQNHGIAGTTYYGLAKYTTSAISTSTTTAATPASINSLSQNMVSGAPVYSATATYAVGDRVRYGYLTYVCKTAITTAEAWNAEHWTALPALQTQLDTHTGDTTVHITTAERTAWNAKTSNTGTVTSIATGTGLSGGPITTSGTLSVDTNTIATKTYAASVGPVTSVNGSTGAVTVSVPSASSTNPVMDGTAAVGTGTTWARADHVHPSDTTRVAKAGDTMTGTLKVGTSGATIQTNGYITGTWLQATANNASSSAQNKIVVQDASGWLYSRTLAQMKTDLGISESGAYPEDEYLAGSVTFGSDGSVTEVLGSYTQKTVFNSDGSITETLSKGGTTVKTRKTTFDSSGNMTVTVS